MFAILNNFILIFSPCFYYTFWKLKNSLVYVSSKIYTAGEKSLVCSMYGRLPGALNDSYTGIHTLLLFSITLPLLTFLDLHDCFLVIKFRLIFSARTLHRRYLYFLFHLIRRLLMSGCPTIGDTCCFLMNRKLYLTHTNVKGIKHSLY